MRRIFRVAGECFGLPGEPLPVFINAPTQFAAGQSVKDAIKTVLRRDGKLELPDATLDYLIDKGGLLVLIDSLNEAPGAEKAIVAFLNADANNQVLVASQAQLFAPSRRGLVYGSRKSVTSRRRLISTRASGWGRGIGWRRRSARSRTTEGPRPDCRGRRESRGRRAADTARRPRGPAWCRYAAQAMD